MIVWKAREGDTNAQNLVVSPTSEGDQIHLNPAATLFTPTLPPPDRQSASSLLKPIFTLTSSTCFFHVFFGLPFFPWPLTSKCASLLFCTTSLVGDTTKFQSLICRSLGSELSAVSPATFHELSKQVFGTPTAHAMARFRSGRFWQPCITTA